MPAVPAATPARSASTAAHLRCDGARRHGCCGLRIDPAAYRFSSFSRMDASTSMPPCCRAGAGRRRSSAPCSPATRETGISIMRMEAGLDTRTGLPRAEPGDCRRTTLRAALHDKLAALGADCIVEALPDIAAGKLTAAAAARRRRYLRRQDCQGRSGTFDGCRRASSWSARIRAFNPISRRFHDAAGRAAQDLARAARGRKRERPATSWMPAADRIVVACGRGALQARGVAASRRQAHGRRRLPARFGARGRRAPRRLTVPRIVQQIQRIAAANGRLRPCRQKPDSTRWRTSGVEHRDLTRGDRGAIQDLCLRQLAPPRKVARRAGPTRQQTGCKSGVAVRSCWWRCISWNTADAAPYAVVDHAVECASQIAGAQMKAFTNAVLRNFQRNRETLLGKADASDEGRFSYPAWWIERLRRELPVGCGQRSACGQCASADDVAGQPPPRRPTHYLLQLATGRHASPPPATTAPCTWHGRCRSISCRGSATGEASVQDAGAQDSPRAARCCETACGCSMPALRPAARPRISWNSPTPT